MEAINSELIRQMILSAANHLQNNRTRINDLNVFPVPDGDTGTNMSRTFGGAVQEALTCGPESGADQILETLAKSSLRNARGNSGVILSQILRGVSLGAHGRRSLKVQDLAAALSESRDTAYRAVMKPTEGTILTVIREMAEFAQKRAQAYKTPLPFLKALLKAARESLDKTPEQLPALKQAGVVDAGGMGLVIILEGAVLAAQGKPVQPETPNSETESESKAAQIDPESIKFLYCTEFLIHKAPERQAKQFMAAIRPKGDCMLVIEDQEVVKVHIHTNHPGFVIEQALKLGELTDLKIDNMKYQHSERLREQMAEEKPQKKYGFVTVSAGRGLDEVFRSVGADRIVQGGQTMNPSTQELLEAVQDVSAETVFVLPNNKNIILAAEQVRELTPQQVIVISSRNIPQGISAMLAFDPEADSETNCAAMGEAMEAVRCGQVTFAARKASIDGFDIRKGDLMGIADGTMKAVGRDLNAVAEELIDSLLGDQAEIITVYYGAETEQKSAEALAQTLREKYEYADVSLIYGGQPVYYYIVAVE